MKNILLEFKKAKNLQYIDWSNEFEILINSFVDKENLKTDWDFGENWDIFRDKSNNILFMINKDLPIVFINKNVSEIQSVFDNIKLHKVYVDTFEKAEWYVDIKELAEKIPEIEWIVAENIINTNKFSLRSLYFATVYS